MRPTVSADGTLVYGSTGGGSGVQMVWRNRSGEKTGEIVADQRILGPRLSPDGLRVAAMTLEGSNNDVWVYHIQRGSKTRLTTDLKRDYNPA